MSAQARISQADMERAVKAAQKAAPTSRIRFDLQNQCIDIILGEAALKAEVSDLEVWTDDD